MKLLVVSHPCSTAANQALFAEIRRITGWDVRLAVPAGWRDEFGNALDQPDWPGLEGRVMKLPVMFNGNIILHLYRFGWGDYLRSENFDAIYMHHEPYAAATGQIHLANSRLSRPAAFGFYSAQNIRKSYPPPFSWIERRVLGTSAFSFPVSRTVAQVLKDKAARGRCEVSPLPFDPALYFPLAGGAAAPAGPGVAIGYVGRIVEPKGLRTLALALEKIRDLEWTFHVVGTGDFRPALERLLEASGLLGRSVFHGFVPHLETPALLRTFDILAVPSETQPGWKEQFGRVIIEALASGVPVAGSDSGEIPELIRASRGGLVFPEKDSDALAGVLRSLLENPAQRRELAACGRVWVLENMTLETVARRMAGTIREAVG